MTDKISTPRISIVIPLFNESAVFSFLIEEIDSLLKRIPDAEVVMIDDGSVDGTSDLVRKKSLEDKRYQGIVFSRNFGHQIALSAGLKYARGTEAVMIIDADLQDPPQLIDDFLSNLRDGYDVIYGIRRKRKESPIKRLMYYLYYRILRRASYINIPLDSGDFCMMSRRVVNIINSMSEESRFIRGMRSWVGFRQKGIEYERNVRRAGKSNYSIRDLFRLGYTGLFNFSVYPVKIMTRLGFFAIGVSMIYFLNVLYQKIFTVDYPVGFTAIVFLIIFFGGVQLLSIGILGEYIVRIYFQSKNRPLFIVSEHIADGAKQE